MTWILILLGSVLALIVLVFVAGSLLPERYGARGYLDVSASAEQLWPKLLDYRAHPVSAKMAKAIEPLPDENGLPVWLESLGSSKIRVNTVESKSASRLVLDLADTVVPMTARAVIELENRGGGCRIRMSNDAVIKNGTWHVPVFRVLMTLFGGMRGGIKAYLRQIAGEARARVEWE